MSTDDQHVLPRETAIRLMVEAQRQPDAEVCGLIGRDDQGQVEVYPVANIAAEPEHAFEMAPAALIEAMRRIRERGQQLMAIYHSHPAAEAVPSKPDLRDHGYPEALQIIVSMDIKGVLQLRCWDVSSGEAREVGIGVA